MCEHIEKEYTTLKYNDYNDIYSGNSWEFTRVTLWKHVYSSCILETPKLKKMFPRYNIQSNYKIILSSPKGLKYLHGGQHNNYLVVTQLM